MSSGVQLYVHKFGHGKMRNKKVENRKKRHYTRMAVLHSLISPWKRKGKKRKKKVITTRGIRIWSPIQVLSPPNRLTRLSLQGQTLRNNIQLDIFQYLRNYNEQIFLPLFRFQMLCYKYGLC